MKIVVSALLALTALHCLAQEDVLRPKGRPAGSPAPNGTTRLTAYMGVEAGININMLSQKITWATTLENSPEEVLQSGTGISPMIGLFADVPLSRSIGIQFRAAYDPKYVSNTKSDGIVEAERLSNKGVITGFGPIDATVESHYHITASAISIAALGRFNLVDELFLTAGPVLNLAVADVQRTDRLTVLEPDDVNILIDYEGNSGTYKEITRETSLHQSILPQSVATEASTYATTRLAVEFGLGYRFFVNQSKSIYLAPNVRYQLFLTPLTESFTSLDNSRWESEGMVPMSFDKASLNTLAIILQLGFAL